MKHGFVKIAAAIPMVKVADCEYNKEQILSLLTKADGVGVEIVCFPELSVTGYSCQDLFHQQLLLEEAEAALLKIIDFSRNLNVTAIIGIPVMHREVLYNCAAVVQQGRLHALVPKTYIPNYKEFYEHRWFASGSNVAHGEMVHLCGQNVPIDTSVLFDLGNYSFGIEICEDVWSVVPPSSHLCLHGADIIFNLSASNELIGKADYMASLVANQSARTLSGYVYTSCGWGESTQDVVFAGRAYVAENGRILSEAERFCLSPQLLINEIDVELLRSERRVNTSFCAAKSLENQDVKVSVINLDPINISLEDLALSRNIDAHPFVPTGEALNERCEEILFIQSQGLATRINHTHASTVVVGISGGLDSTLALLVCVHAFDRLGLDRKGIVGVTMPGFGTTDRTYNNAMDLMKSLGITIREIPIADAVNQHFRDIQHDPAIHDVTYENSQARERTQILMDVANQVGGFVIGTGDLSELALGWATYNGDHMSMYAVNVSIPKTLVKHLVVWVAENLMDENSAKILRDVADTPISPELIPANPDGTIQQKTEDLVGPYELHDFFLYYVLRYGFRPSKIYWMAQKAFDEKYTSEVIKKWLTVFYRRFFAQQFKRSCLPDGPKVGSCSLSPRGDWRMPSDASSALWLSECEVL